MRIAFDHQIFSWQEYGGISRYFCELASNLSQVDDVEFRIMSPLYINSYLSALPKEVNIKGRKVSGCTIAGLFCRAVNQVLEPSALARFLPDVVHETYYSSNRFAPVDSKLVLTVHDMIHERLPNCFSERDSTSRAKAHAVARADHIICISKCTRNDLIEILGVDPEKISIIYHGFSLAKQAGEEIAIQYGDRPFFLYVGSRIGYKNFNMLLNAYATNNMLQRDFDLVLFGGGKQTINEKKLINRLGINADRIHYFSGDDGVLSRLYQKATLFIYPSLYEGFGIPPLEAMSFDCPVVCSDASSIPEVVGNAAELFDPRSADSLMKAIERVLNDKELRQALIETGRERIKCFSWKQCAEQTLSVYRSVLS